MALWLPSDLGSSVCKLYLDAKVGVTQASGAVSAWADQSGNSNNASQSTAGYKPVYSATSLNSQEGITGDASDDLMNLTAALPGVTDFFHETSGVNGATIDGVQNSDYHFGTDPAGPGLIGIVWGSNTWTYYENGVVVATQSNTTSTSGAIFYLGSTTSQAFSYRRIYQNNGGSYVIFDNTGQYGPLAGTLGAIVCTSGTLASADREKIEGSLLWRWGLDSLLASGHPYKSAAPTTSSGGTANGATVSVAISAVSGAATGTASTSGSNIAVTVSAIGGTATGGGSATANGATVTVTVSNVAGTAAANSSISGVTQTVTISAIGGTASASGNATANGATVVVTVSPVSGTASGSAGTTGSTQAVTVSVISGLASGNSSASGATVVVTTSVIAGTASGTATVSGAVSTVTISAIGGTATAATATAPGATVVVTFSILYGKASGTQVLSPAASLYGV